MSKKPSVVDRALEYVDGSQSELARRLSKISGEDISRQHVFGWVTRGTFPRRMLIHVEALCGISLEELVQAEPKERDEGNVVDRAIRYLGAEANATTLADKLSEMTGRRITRQSVNSWQAIGQFPVDVVPYVHILAHIPVKDMIPNARPRRGGRKSRRTQSGA